MISRLWKSSTWQTFTKVILMRMKVYLIKCFEWADDKQNLVEYFNTLETIFSSTYRLIDRWSLKSAYEILKGKVDRCWKVS